MILHTPAVLLLSSRILTYPACASLAMHLMQARAVSSTSRGGARGFFATRGSDHACDGTAAFVAQGGGLRVHTTEAAPSSTSTSASTAMPPPSQRVSVLPAHVRVGLFGGAIDGVAGKPSALSMRGGAMAMSRCGGYRWLIIICNSNF